MCTSAVSGLRGGPGPLRVDIVVDNMNEVRPTWVERGTRASSCTWTLCTGGAPLCPFNVEGVCLQTNGVKFRV